VRIVPTWQRKVRLQTRCIACFWQIAAGFLI
jgi:hypothetical protein